MRTSSPGDAELIVQKLPCDMGIHRNPRKGTLNAPEVLLENMEFEREVMVDEVFPDEFDLEETQRRIEENTSELEGYGRPVVSVGGDHSVSFPAIKALKRKHPELKLVWLDSHLDMKRKVDGHVSHDVVVRELIETGLFEEDEVWFVGVTRTDHDEEEFMEGRDFNVYGPGELEDFLREFEQGEQPVYLSVDIDVLKPELAPGTGYPDGELELENVLDLVDALKPVFSDIVEFAPSLDRDQRGLKSSREVLRALAESTQRY